ncbi:DNA topoisomerase 2 isoform X2 [Amborella trichopoda]|uniref:DNA topoisomerase 2 isoform X2 n=1 Tax=Amborella trichopoda TaxID=13333 RepID=UPI0005D3B7CA|nr:DNA topoisomerase 2 isoform X2 [Amborella trichopoda]|eukprot:XP_011621441.1 DNA topoisomerase 2 isoform X2 [Amborella trichopoda]
MAAIDKKKPLETSSNFNSNAANLTTINGSKPGKTIEETYQKKTQLEHILLRPDTYIGSVEKHTQNLWVYEENKMVHRSISYVPGLYKIFDEILVNAADNKQRDPSMDSLKVDIDVEQNTVSVYNNGDGVPVEIHQEEGVYVPEMIFGHLLTSSNYNDEVKKTTGGRNGYGAKLTNIFSTQFVIETADGKRQKKYKQVFTSNMGSKSEPAITKCKAGENWTKVTFKPDLAKFNMTYLEEDVVALMKKRVVDLAGCLGKTVKVELNGKRLPVKSFVDYVDLYVKSASEARPEPLPRIVEKVNNRWEICVSLSEGQFQQVSFVNGIATIKGGTHVEYVTGQIANHIMNIANKKNKNAGIKAHTVRNHLWVFVNALIDNPAFDSQTKETLTTRQGSFGSKCELSEEFLKKAANSGIVESLLSWADFKQSKDLKKTDGTKCQRITGLPKLEDANQAGGRNSEKCTLILTEGDSAKALAMAGISVVGRDHFGVFPLRGKLLNVREATKTQIKDNKEIQNIKQILGLQHGKVYDSVKSLRYGHLMIMTDQDHDGSHIKGLLINFIHSFWPSLLKVPSFLVEFITPIVKARNKNGKVLSFYTLPEYESWKESLGGNARGWTIKYYKGLGTSTSQEGKEYFKEINKHKKDFIWVDDQDGDAIELAFSKKKIEARKNWLRHFEPGTYLDQKEKLIKYSDFVNKELILFSMADLQRSIPSMVDGLKPGQRKILFCSFKRNFVSQAKVVQFSGYVSEHSAYHHGEQSLAATIVGMAQDFVGTNNINLLQPLGQFGTRNRGGKDAASARYIFTCLSPITRFLFPKDDDVLLDYQNEDGQCIEPNWYMPIIPLVLINGSEGIGTGWSSYVPNYNPRDVAANVKRLLNGESMLPMEPWYKGFKGTIEKSATKEGGVGYTVSGIVEEINETTLRITELPIRRWTEDYKVYLESLRTGSEKTKEPFIVDYKEHNTDTRVHFDVLLPEENMKISQQEGLMKMFKLTTTISTSNMHLFNAKGVIKKYDTPEQILEEFFHLRLDYYGKRKKVLLDNLELELLKLDNKARFILGVVNGEIVVSKRKRADLVLELRDKGFTPFPKKSKNVEAALAGATPVDEEGEESPEVDDRGINASDYDYLLSMAIGTLTIEKVQELCAEKDKLEHDVKELRGLTPKALWIKDLDAFLAQLDAEAVQEAKDDEYELNNMVSDAAKIFRQVGKNPRKNTKKPAPAEHVDTDASDTTTTEVAAKPKKRAPKKAPTKKKDVEDMEDDLLLDLNARLAKYNIESSPEHADMETDLPERREPSKRAVSKPQQVYADISDDESEHLEEIEEEKEEEQEDEDPKPAKGKKKQAPKPKEKKKMDGSSDEEFVISDEDLSVFDIETEDAPPKPKGRAKKPLSNKPKAPTGAAKKRGAASSKQPILNQKLITEVLKPVGVSPEKKVRKMRASPFNKKSGSVLGRIERESKAEESKDGSPLSLEREEKVVMAARNRPQRAKPAPKYILSDSESDAANDSDFNDDE